MSKLNDSTLKILKKYRLDTDMSVFGNENKLYDVVKVMDDMVGNQVSKYVASVNYVNSNQTTNVSARTASGALKDYDIDYNKVLTNKSIVYLFEPVSMKKIGELSINSAVIPLAILQVNDTDYGYMVYNNELKKIYCSSDYLGSSDLTGQLINGGAVFKPIFWFSEKNFEFYIPSGINLESFLSSSNNLTLSVQQIQNGPITVPDELKIFANKDSYYSLGSYGKTLNGIYSGITYIGEI